MTPNSSSSSTTRPIRPWLRTENILAGLLVCIYVCAFLISLGPRWFDPNCSQNDLQQQGFEFYRANHPDIFKDDLVFRSMRAYLPPLHYALGLALTAPTDNPMITGHVIMLIQLLICSLSIFLIVNKLSGVIPACFAMIWFLHSREIMHLMAGGLPRGWIGPVLATVLVGIINRNLILIWLALLAGSLLNPVAAFLGLASYGLILITRLSVKSSRAETWHHLRIFLLAAPCIGLVTLLTTVRDGDIGVMISMSVASRLQGFSKLGGRFPILPLSSPWNEIRTHAFQVFLGPWSDLTPSERIYYPISLALGLTSLGALALLKRRRALPLEIIYYGVAIIICYFLARYVAFQLYIPDRYLQTPSAIFFITTTTITIWNLFREKPWVSRGALALLATFIFATSGLGLRGREMFDVCATRQSNLWRVLREETPEDALIAGHPNQLNGVQLFGMRSAFITTETAHPFYDAYYAEVKRRIAITFQAYYAPNWQTVYNLLQPEGIDFFTYRIDDFASPMPKTAYDLPFLSMLRRLSSGAYESYAFSTLPTTLSPQYPFLVYRDERIAIIDIKKLGNWLR